MHLEKKHEQELAQRKGLARKTIIQSIWLLFSTAVAYFLARFLFSNGIVSPNWFRDLIAAFLNLFGANMSRGDIPLWAGWGLLILFILFIMQIIFFFGYAFANPLGRYKGGPTLYSRNKDPFDGRF